jgi:hypothetical protein
MGVARAGRLSEAILTTRRWMVPRLLVYNSGADVDVRAPMDAVELRTLTDGVA